MVVWKGEQRSGMKEMFRWFAHVSFGSREKKGGKLVHLIFRSCAGDSGLLELSVEILRCLYADIDHLFRYFG